MKINSLILEKFFFIILGLSISIYFSWLSSWQIFEQDIFWLIRAGEEILSTGKIQEREAWSYTANGTIWYHFQWFTSIALLTVKNLFGKIESLVILRSLLVGLWMVLISLICWFSVINKKRFLSLYLIMILPCFYLMNWIRLQLRPDLFGLIFFTALVLMNVIQISSIRKKVFSLLFIFLWAQFHAGTVFLGIYYFSISLILEFFQNKSDKIKAIYWILGSFIVGLATPVHIHIFEILMETRKIEGNPDQQPFTWSFLNYSHGGWGYLIWFIFSLLMIILLTVFSRKTEELKVPYKNTTFVSLLFVSFTILFFQKMRTIPYLTVSMLPFFTAGVVFYLEKLRVKQVIIWIFFVLFFIGGMWGYVLPDHRTLAEPLGSRVSELWFPVKSVQFIKEQNIKGNMYNYFDFGGYLINELRSFPVFYDGRETPFLKVSKERQLASQTPELYEKFLLKYNINFVIEKLPLSPKDSDNHTRFYPKSEWARVFSDFASVVYIRRIFEHYEVIKKYESQTANTQSPHAIPSQEEISRLLREAQEQIKSKNKK